MLIFCTKTGFELENVPYLVCAVTGANVASPRGRGSQEYRLDGRTKVCFGFLAELVVIKNYLNSMLYSNQQALGSFLGIFERKAFEAAAHRLKRYGYGMPSAALWLGLGQTSYWAIGGSPKAQVGSRNSVDLETGILSSDPITELGFKSLLARGTAGLVVMDLKGLIVLGGEDHGI